MSAPIILTILIIENLFLVAGLIVYLYRKCQKCQQVKQIDRVFAKLCEKCEKGNLKNPKKDPSREYVKL